MFEIPDGCMASLNAMCKNPNGTTRKVPIELHRAGDKLWLKYGYSPVLTDELKANLDGMTWHGFKDPSIKQWSCSYNEHNLFRFLFLAGSDPYKQFDTPNVTIETSHPLKAHQREMAGFWLAKRASIWAAEMGLGKSLTAISCVEYLYSLGRLLPTDEVFWVAPKSALVSVQLEYKKWGCKFPVRFLTYDALKKYVETIDAGTTPPKVIIGDESHKLKCHVTQRTVAFAHVTRAMRKEHGDNCYVLLMTGTPAPKSPLDWYSQCEIVQPGYLKEGNINSFKYRLGLIKQKESCDGAGMFPELITWRDDENKCKECGKFADAWEHSRENDESHKFIKSINEVEFLYERMKNLVLVKTKAECLDLPDKIYRKVYCKPASSTLRAMKMIAKTQESTIKVLTLLRELSDGFQYEDIENGKKTCELCHGSGTYVNYDYIGPDKTSTFIQSLIESCRSSDQHSAFQRTANQLELAVECSLSPEDVIIPHLEFPQYFEHREGECPNCDGLGQVPNVVQSYRNTSTAKDKALIDILDEHEDVQRLVIYAGFKASIDRCIEIAKDNDWEWIKLDGRGWLSSLEGKPPELMSKFQDKNFDTKICFIGNPGSAGTGLTMTASPSIVYFSNDFNADSRIQSEDRIHRMGMDENRGATIIDLIHLPTDDYVLDNLLKKRRLQDMSLGQLIGVMDNELPRSDYV